MDIKTFLKTQRLIRKNQGICRDCNKPIALTSTCFCEDHLTANRLRTYKYRTKYHQLKESANRRDIPFELEQQHFTDWHNTQPKCCHYCKITEKDMRARGIAKPTLTVDRLDSSIGYAPGNLCIACNRCNVHKGRFFSESEWLEIVEKYILPRLEDYHK